MAESVPIGSAVAKATNIITGGEGSDNLQGDGGICSFNRRAISVSIIFLMVMVMVDGVLLGQAASIP